jgi:hypothetical protein
MNPPSIWFHQYTEIIDSIFHAGKGTLEQRIEKSADSLIQESMRPVMKVFTERICSLFTARQP